MGVKVTVNKPWSNSVVSAQWRSPWLFPNVDLGVQDRSQGQDPLIGQVHQARFQNKKISKVESFLEILKHCDLTATAKVSTKKREMESLKTKTCT